MSSKLEWLCAVIALSLLGGCSLEQMQEDVRLKPYAPSPFFADGSSSRLPVPGTVARGELWEDDLLYRGEIDGRVADRFPFRLQRADLLRGRERFEIHCSPCHGRTGLGDGMIAQRGFSRPPSYFSARLLSAPAGHFYRVITDGFGAMLPYADQVEVHDRWRIVAYIRALQLSRSVPRASLGAAADDTTLEANAQPLDENGRPQ